MNARRAPAACLPGTRRTLLTVCAMTATIMQALDTTIANVALPYMQGSLSASLDQISWVLTSYIVAAAIMTAPDRLARRPLRPQAACSSSASAASRVASLLCALAQNIEQIVVVPPAAGHVRRRAGAAVAIGDARRLSDRAARLRRWRSGASASCSARSWGRRSAAWLTENYSWHWVFFINLPVGILTVLGLLVFMDETKTQNAQCVRLVRLPGARRRHRLAAADARSRRAGRLVRL